MSLEKGSNKKVISKNISKEVHAGKSARQAVAIALNVAGKGRKRKKRQSSDGTLYA